MGCFSSHVNHHDEFMFQCILVSNMASHGYYHTQRHGRDTTNNCTESRSENQRLGHHGLGTKGAVSVPKWSAYFWQELMQVTYMYVTSYGETLTWFLRAWCWIFWCIWTWMTLAHMCSCAQRNNEGGIDETISMQSVTGILVDKFGFPVQDDEVRNCQRCCLKICKLYADFLPHHTSWHWFPTVHVCACIICQPFGLLHCASWLACLNIWRGSHVHIIGNLYYDHIMQRFLWVAYTCI